MKCKYNNNCHKSHTQHKCELKFSIKTLFYNPLSKALRAALVPQPTHKNNNNFVVIQNRNPAGKKENFICLADDDDVGLV